MSKKREFIETPNLVSTPMRKVLAVKIFGSKFFDLPACAIKAYDSNKKQLNLISDDQFFNGLFRLRLRLRRRRSERSLFPFSFISSPILPILHKKSVKPKLKISSFCCHFDVFFFFLNLSFPSTLRSQTIPFIDF